MEFTKFGGTTQQRAWFDQALADLLYQYDHPTLPCTVTVLWADQDALQALGDHGVGTYFAFTEVDPTATAAAIHIWDGLDTQGGRFSGQDFYMETVAHEIGHIVAGIRSVQNANLQTEFATMVSGSGGWTSGEWEDRYLEAFAEIFKDVFLPSRKFDNRTSHKLIRGRFDAYLALVNTSSIQHEQAHIDLDPVPNPTHPLGEHGSPLSLWGPGAPDPYYWGIGGGQSFGWDAGLTGGVFTPLDDRTGMSATVLNFDLTMQPDFDLSYAAGLEAAEYVGWGNGWWNSDFGVGDDPSGYNLIRGRRLYNSRFGFKTVLDDVDQPGQQETSDPDYGGPLFFMRWELIDPFDHLIEAEAIAAQALLDSTYSHLEPLIGQVPMFSGGLSSPPNLRTFGFSADCPVRLNIGVEASGWITELVAGVETTVNGGGIGDVRPSGPGVTEEWWDRYFRVLFIYRFPDPPWPYPASFTVAIPSGPKTRKVQYQGNGWGNRRGSNRRFVGVPSPTVNLDE